MSSRSKNKQIQDIRSSILVVQWGVLLSAILISAILFLTYSTEICSLKSPVWFAAHITVYAIINMVLSRYLCYNPEDEESECGNGRLFFALVLILVAIIAAVVLLISMIVDIVNLGCANVPACNNVYAAYLATWILIILYIILSIILVLYLGFYVRSLRYNYLRRRNRNIGSRIVPDIKIKRRYD